MCSAPSYWLRAAARVGCGAAWALALLACSGSAELPEHARPSRRSRAPVAEPIGALPPSPVAEPIGALPPSTFPAPARLIALGDVHGDLAAMVSALRLGGAIDADLHWSGGTLWVVQTGDLLDRGDDEDEILELLARLEIEAAAAGGRVLVLNGNHELMNAQGDFRYVTEEGFEDFAQYAGPGSGSRALRGRTAAFAPGGPVARAFAAHATAVRVGDTVFVHGGISSSAAARGLDAINQETRRFLSGEGPLSRAMLGEDSPVWHREYALHSAAETDPVTCAELASALDTLGARRMVVGHTVQPHGISSACDDRVYRIDVGLARHYGGPTQVLQLEGDRIEVLR